KISRSCAGEGAAATATAGRRSSPIPPPAARAAEAIEPRLTISRREDTFPPGFGSAARPTVLLLTPRNGDRRPVVAKLAVLAKGRAAAPAIRAELAIRKKDA